MIPPNKLFPGIHILEHVVHGLDKVVVQKPDGGVLVVFLEGNYGATSALTAPQISPREPSIPAKLFDALTVVPLFCPNNTPTTLFLPFPDRAKWSHALSSTRGAIVTVTLGRESCVC